MTQRYRLERLQLIRHPLDEVFAFFSDAYNLEALTPPQLHFHILTPCPIAMHAGTLIDYRLKLFGIPFSWQTQIDEFEPGRRFVDRQLRGPYRLWRHVHEFTAVDNGTLMIDEVDYELPWGPLGTLAHLLLVRRTLDKIFDYRRDRIVDLLETDRTLSAGKI
jgi:ligand-binding SRPBCC domain-containing protein